MNDSTGLLHLVTSILLFPRLFQDRFLDFAWGSFEIQTGLAIAKRLFLLLPVLAVIGACWITIAALLTVVFRQRRQQFIVALIITWWDLGKSVFSFWGGIFKFIFTLIVALLGLIRILLQTVLTFAWDVISVPFRFLASLGRNVMGSKTPWIAVVLTLFWCIIEAMIFTYVTTPLVMDVFSNITGEYLSGMAVRVPLFIFLFFIVLGSYAVLASFVESAKKREIKNILGIGVIEIVVLLVEVMFLYREFVDSLVPWFAQYSENFDLGVGGTLAIACFVWFGIRSLSWFLFASHGTPTLLSIIQGRGVESGEKEAATYPVLLPGTTQMMDRIRQDGEWIGRKGQEIFDHLLLPPLQVIASFINFCILLFTGKHLFELPFRSVSDITQSGVIIETLAQTAVNQKQKTKTPQPVIETEG